jgi:hypothetical protein
LSYFAVTYFLLITSLTICLISSALVFFSPITILMVTAKEIIALKGGEISWLKNKPIRYPTSTPEITAITEFLRYLLTTLSDQMIDGIDVQMKAIRVAKAAPSEP